MYTNNLYCSYEFRSGIKSQSICTSTTKFTLARLLAKIYIYTEVYSKSFTVSAREVGKCLEEQRCTNLTMILSIKVKQS